MVLSDFVPSVDVKVKGEVVSIVMIVSKVGLFVVGKLVVEW